MSCRNYPEKPTPVDEERSRGQAGRGQGAWTSKEEEKGQSQGRGGLWELRVSVPGAEGTSICGVRLPNDVLSQP